MAQRFICDRSHHVRLALSVWLAALLTVPTPGLAAGGSGMDITAERGSTEAVYQLRIYEIFEHNKAAFHARFRDHAVRIMKRYDFTIRSMWESRLNGRTEFVYLLEWASEAVMKETTARCCRA